jgi:hypothetical protein
LASEPPGYGRSRPLLTRGTSRARHPLSPLESSGDKLMDRASGEVIDTPDGAKRFCALFRVEDEILFEWPVDTVDEGNARIQEALSFLHRKILEARGMISTALH